MNIWTLVWREIFVRRNQLITSFLAILLGITAIVAINNITFYSEKAVARELDALGANILILPKSASMQDYYSADMQEDEFPEEYVTRLLTSDIQGLDNLSPKLSIPIEMSGHSVILTGILPKDEFAAKALWQGAGVFGRPEGCGVIDVPNVPGDNAGAPLRNRVIETLGSNEVLVGADIGESLNLNQNDSIQIMETEFNVIAILPESGTVDDSRIFAHLHTVQQLAGKESVINVIEVVGCCDQISQGLVQDINQLLPEARVVTITQIVDTQIKTNKMMSQLSMIFLVIIVLVGGVSIANYIYGNVTERRREIGTFMALGANPSLVLKMFLLKALLLGFAGGICGYGLGTVLAITLGPKIAGIPVLPMPVLLIWAIFISLAIAVVASYFPARYAANLDPCKALLEL